PCSALHGCLATEGAVRALLPALLPLKPVPPRASRRGCPPAGLLQIPRVTVAGLRIEGIQQGVADACPVRKQLTSVPALPRNAVVDDKGIPAVRPKLKLPDDCKAVLPIGLREGTGLALVESRAKVNLAEVGREVKVHGHNLLERVGMGRQFVPFDLTVKGRA